MKLVPLKHIKIKKRSKTSNLVNQMQTTAYNARALAQASSILAEAISDKECKLFMGLAGALVAGGMRKIIIDMLEKKWIDIFVTTGANLTHDLIEALGFRHYLGDEKVKDAMLHKKGINKIYNVYMKNKVYNALEEF
ncbi:MAG: deoxyhypusine synthase family protein, partial [Candidatus Pacearchaeota archaeon]|nr:deoxyhypusine synthase family protein [Candidatus Pacearchaeota archaeon]